MPCQSDYLDSSGEEREASRVVALLAELKGTPLPRDYGSGYDPRVYNKCVDLDALTAKLCAALQKVDVTKYSLEMQMWWRNHQRADAERREQEKRVWSEETLRKAALRKLTAKERKALGLTDDES